MNDEKQAFAQACAFLFAFSCANERYGDLQHLRPVRWIFNLSLVIFAMEKRKKIRFDTVTRVQKRELDLCGKSVVSSVLRFSLGLP